jgi:hypothetical protein
MLLSALTLALAGCSGINTSQSVSPATFLVPGFFGQVEPPAPALPWAPPTFSEQSVRTFVDAK